MTNEERTALRDLHKAIREMGKAEFVGTPDLVFTYWYLRSSFTGLDLADVAREGVHGGKNDKNVDGAYIDEQARRIYLLQAKYRRAAAGRREGAGELHKFATLGDAVLRYEDNEFHEFVNDAKPDVADRLRQARKLAGNDYELELHYVTLGTLPAKDVSSAKRTAKAAGARLTVVECADVLRTWLHFRETLQAPPPPFSLEPGEGDESITRSILERADNRARLNCWVFPMRGDLLGKLFRDIGPRLFARNIRGYLGGANTTNAAMKATIRKEPDNFFYYNNGITIIADEVTWTKDETGKEEFIVELGQIINGQQTVRTLADSSGAEKCSVMVKLIALKGWESTQGAEYRHLVSSIVEATNKQSAIRSADLMANSRVQVVLEMALRRLGYSYVRKRQVTAMVRGKGQIRITKEEMAQAVAGCNLDPVDIRSGKDKLFETALLYDKVFNSENPYYYLARWWLFRHATVRSKREERRGYAKWMALRYGWDVLAPSLRTERAKEAFVSLCRSKNRALERALGVFFDRIFVAAHKYYLDRRNKELRERQQDYDRRALKGRRFGSRPTTPAELSGFYRAKRGRHDDFRDSWARRALTGGDQKYRQALKRIVTSIDQVST